MSNAANVVPIVAISGFMIAFAFGAIASRTNFCTMGAISDVVNMGHWGRMRMWLLAIAVAILGTSGLHLAGLVDLSKSIYVRPNLAWLSHGLGGLLFGIGMTLGSGCGNKTLVRLGGGNLKSIVVLAFLAVAAYMTLKGLFAVWRTTWLDPVAVDLGAHAMAGQDLASVIAAAFGMDRRMALTVLAPAIAGLLLAFAFANREFRASRDHVFGGIAIGLLVVAGWYVTGHVGYAENPETLEVGYLGTNSRTLESLSFVAPVAYTLELLLLWTDKSLAITFGIAIALGVIAGSAAHAIASRTFRWEGFSSAQDTGQHIAGGILMGAGGVTALGCTIGQGITGLSTLAIGSLIASLSIVAGCWATLRYQYWRLERAG